VYGKCFAVGFLAGIDSGGSRIEFGSHEELTEVRRQTAVTGADRRKW
jgi:hypothetical protein